MRTIKLLIVLSFAFLLTGCNNKDASLSGLIANEESLNMLLKTDTFKCDDINWQDVIFLGEKILVTKNELFDIVMENGKLFSNNQNCKKNNIDSDENEISIINNLYYDSIIFKISDNYYEYRNGTISELSSYESKLYSIPALEGYKKVGNSLYLNDGNIYEIELTEKDNSEYQINKKVYLSADDVGFIKDAKMKLIPTFGKDIINYDETTTPSIVVTDNGVYVLKPNNDCKKYVDVECEYEYQKSTLYEKYKDDFSYIGTSYSILKNGNVIDSAIFYYNV